jgi:hypothetical protein
VRRERDHCARPIDVRRARVREWAIERRVGGAVHDVRDGAVKFSEVIVRQAECRAMTDIPSDSSNGWGQARTHTAARTTCQGHYLRIARASEPRHELAT